MCNIFTAFIKGSMGMNDRHAHGKVVDGFKGVSLEPLAGTSHTSRMRSMWCQYVAWKRYYAEALQTHPVDQIFKMSLRNINALFLLLSIFIFSHVYTVATLYLLYYTPAFLLYIPLIYSSLNPSDYGKYKAFKAEDLYVHVAASSTCPILNTMVDQYHIFSVYNHALILGVEMKLFIFKFQSHLRSPGFGDEFSKTYNSDQSVCAEKKWNAKQKKKRTDIVCIELVDSNKCSNGGSSQTPFCNLTNNGEFTGR
jgi:hypothetical protein